MMVRRDSWPSMGAVSARGALSGGLERGREANSSSIDFGGAPPFCCGMPTAGMAMVLLLGADSRGDADAPAAERPFVFAHDRLGSGEHAEEQLESFDRAAHAVELDRLADQAALLGHRPILVEDHGRPGGQPGQELLRRLV